MNIRSFNIPATNKTEVESKLIRLNKRALKIGLEDITWIWGKVYLNDNEELIIPIELSGPLQVKYEDWEFVATLQHLNTGENIIRSISNNVVIPKEFRDTGSICQHCLINRYRKDTYLVKDIHSDAILQVGSSCIKDFLGGKSPDNILQKAELISNLMEYMSGISGKFIPGSEDLFHIVKFLSQTSAVIRDHGWVSKTKSQESGLTSTVCLVEFNFNPPNIFFVPSPVKQEDIDLATEASDWAENLTDFECSKSDYLHNIRAISRSGMVGYRTMGFAASIISAYQRAMEANKPKKIKPISNYIGNIKEKKVFDALLLKHNFNYEGSYGTSYKYIFEDNDGNVLVWSSSNNKDLIIGNKYSIKGTIKDHSEYKGTKQTILTRCEILN